MDSGTGMDFYSHVLLRRPDGGCNFSTSKSEYTELAIKVVDEILKHNKISYHMHLRLNVNCTHPDNDHQESDRHVDHNFPHKNLIIYLTGSGGNTYVEDEFHDPKEDDVILFQGEHWMKRPNIGRRIILVNTLLT